jgi:hypothetical protein
MNNPNIQECLFIGGCVDGERRYTHIRNERVLVENPCSVESLISMPSDSKISTIGLDYQEYHRQRLIEQDGREYYVYLYSSNGNTIERLLEGYGRSIQRSGT